MEIYKSDLLKFSNFNLFCFTICRFSQGRRIFPERCYIGKLFQSLIRTNILTSRCQKQFVATLIPYFRWCGSYHFLGCFQGHKSRGENHILATEGVKYVPGREATRVERQGKGAFLIIFYCRTRPTRASSATGRSTYCLLLYQSTSPPKVQQAVQLNYGC